MFWWIFVYGWCNWIQKWDVCWMIIRASDSGLSLRFTAPYWPSLTLWDVSPGDPTLIYCKDWKSEIDVILAEQERCDEMQAVRKDEWKSSHLFSFRSNVNTFHHSLPCPEFNTAENLSVSVQADTRTGSWLVKRENVWWIRMSWESERAFRSSSLVRMGIIIYSLFFYSLLTFLLLFVV